MSEDTTPDNPIRRFIIGPQIFNVVKAALMDSEIEELPTSFDRGLDFSITKTSKGGYADYSTSKWARKESALTNVERAAIDAHGLFNLKDFLPKKPTATELQVINDMFEASVDGQAYDPDRWGQYYKPAGLQVAGGGRAEVDEDAPPVRAAAPAPRPAPAPVAKDDEDDAPFETAPAATEAPKASGNARAEDILAMIRARQK